MVTTSMPPHTGFAVASRNWPMSMADMYTCAVVYAPPKIHDATSSGSKMSTSSPSTASAAPPASQERCARRAVRPKWLTMSSIMSSATCAFG